MTPFLNRCKSRGRHLLLVSIVVFPLHLGLAPVAKVVVECFRGLLHLYTERSESKNTRILFHPARSVLSPDTGKMIRKPDLC